MHIKFEFVGGPHDGRVAAGFVGEAGDAERYYLFTNHGTLGYLFKVASEYAIETLAREGLRAEKKHHFQKHFYVIADRLEHQDEVCVRAKYVPNAPRERPLT
ncbi:MAG: hypothetical protein KY476_03275 [Planctomycetes bacterium]|nr:hypothetical protein [Planctomycetota bacterium]